MKEPMFDWDGHNPRKIQALRIAAEEVEQALMSDPILIYGQDVAGEQRFVYYGGTDAGRLLAVVVTERRAAIRVVTAYELDAGQKRDFPRRRMQGDRRQ